MNDGLDPFPEPKPGDEELVIGWAIEDDPGIPVYLDGTDSVTLFVEASWEFVLLLDPVAAFPSGNGYVVSISSSSAAGT